MSYDLWNCFFNFKSWKNIHKLANTGSLKLFIHPDTPLSTDLIKDELSAS